MQVQQVSFNAAGGASGQANNEAVAAMTGIPAQDLYMAEWHNSIMRPCHYLALHRSYGCLVLAIRWGTPPAWLHPAAGTRCSCVCKAVSFRQAGRQSALQ